MEVINRANNASVLMNFLLKEIHLPSKCTHIQFVEAFSKLQSDRTKYELELNHIYLDSLKKVSDQVEQQKEGISE